MIIIETVLFIRVHNAVQRSRVVIIHTMVFIREIIVRHRVNNAICTCPTREHAVGVIGLIMLFVRVPPENTVGVIGLL